MESSQSSIEKLNPIFKNPRSVLFIGLVLSLIVSIFVDHIYQINQRNSDIEKAHKVAQDVKLAFEQYTHPLQGIVSNVHLSNLKMNAFEFQKSSKARQFYSNFKGALGFGFIRKVKNENITKYISEQRKTRPFFELKTPPDSKNYFVKDEKWVIEMIEPFQVNQKAVGLVISEEENRYKAAERAMITGLPTITKSIQLVQADKSEPGFLLFLPIYTTPETPTTESERKEKLYGWAYTPILVKEVVNFIKAQNAQFPSFQIFESVENNRMNPLIKFDKEWISDDSYIKHAIHIAGEKWIIDIKTKQSFMNSYHLWPIIIFLALTCLNLVLYYYLKKNLDQFHFQEEIIKRNVQAVQNATYELNKKTKFLQKVIDELPAMVAYWDKDLKLVLANRTYASFFNKTPQNLIGKPMPEVLTEELYKNNFPYAQMALKGHSQKFERVIKSSMGLERTVLVNYYPDYFADEIIGFLVVSIDITQNKKLEEENRDKQAQLYAKSKLSLLGEMAGGISHEINNPLGIISGKAQLIDLAIKKLKVDSEEKEKLQNNIKIIVSTVERIAKIIKGLRSFSRDSENDPWAYANVNEVISETLSLMKEKFISRQIDVKVIQNSENLNINCNRTQISQVIMNLLSNSIDAIKTLEDKWIKIETNQKNDAVQIRVIDSGLGIPEKVKEKLMTPFFTTKDVGEGTGLGLSISKGILHNHFGSIEYEFYNGHTSFLINLPLIDAALLDKKTAA